jgi:hypothetical protein
MAQDTPEMSRTMSPHNEFEICYQNVSGTIPITLHSVKNFIPSIPTYVQQLRAILSTNQHREQTTRIVNKLRMDFSTMWTNIIHLHELYEDFLPWTLISSPKLASHFRYEVTIIEAFKLSGLSKIYTRYQENYGLRIIPNERCSQHEEDPWMSRLGQELVRATAGSSAGYSNRIVRVCRSESPTTDGNINGDGEISIRYTSSCRTRKRA